MRIRDRQLKKDIDVSSKECPKFECYWPRAHPGIFTQGKGYSSCEASKRGDYICGNREIRGCPESPKLKEIK